MNEEKYEILVVTNDCEETFSLSEAPGEKTRLVEYQKKQLSAELDLRRLVVNLDNTSTLLYIAYNALSGTKVQSKVSGLQNRLSKLCADSQVAMNGIKEKTSVVLINLPIVYELLTSGAATEAMELLAGCSQHAGEMAKASEELADGFDRMVNDTQAALEGSQDLYASDLQKKKEISEQISKMKANQEKLKQQSKELQGTLQEIEGKYADAQRREEKAEKNAMILGIVSMCTSALTLGLGALAQRTKTQGGQQEQQASQKEEQKQEGESNLKRAQEELKEQESAASQAEEEFAKAQKELAAIDAETPGEGEEEIKAHTAKKEAAAQKVEELKKKAAEAKKSVENKKQLAAAAQATLQGISEEMAKERMEQQDTLKKAQATTMELFKMKLDMQKENRAIAGEMAEIAEMLKGQQEAMMSTDKAIDMLKLAIRCLGNIVVTFTETALFWRNVEQGCNNLKDGAFMKQVRAFSTLGSELQSRLYGRDDFKKMLLIYMATWVALHSISKDYYNASKAVGQKVRAHISRNLFEQEAFEEASRLAAEIMQSMQEEQYAIDESSVVIEQMRADM